MNRKSGSTCLLEKASELVPLPFPYTRSPFHGSPFRGNKFSYRNFIFS